MTDPIQDFNRSPKPITSLDDPRLSTIFAVLEDNESYQMLPQHEILFAKEWAKYLVATDNLSTIDQLKGVIDDPFASLQHEIDEDKNFPQETEMAKSLYEDSFNFSATEFERLLREQFPQQNIQSLIDLFRRKNLREFWERVKSEAKSLERRE